MLDEELLDEDVERSPELLELVLVDEDVDELVLCSSATVIITGDKQ